MGTSLGPTGDLEEERDDQVVYRLNKLTVKKNKDGYISSALAWDDLAGKKPVYRSRVVGKEWVLWTAWSRELRHWRPFAIWSMRPRP